jgi:hypothetical protein
MSRSARLVPAALALAVALSACSKSSDTTVPIYLDQEFGDEIAQHVGMLIAAGNGGSMLTLTATAATIPAGASISQDAVRPARDTLFAAGAVAWSLVDTFFTAGNTPQTDYDALSTHGAIHADGAGQIHSATFNASFLHHADLKATGLLALRDTIDLAGTARDSSRAVFVGKFTAATCRLLLVSTITHENGIVLKGQSPATPPLSALSDWTVNATRYDTADTTKVNRASPVQVLIGYDGTTHAVMQVGGLYDYQVDLATGDITRYGAQPLAGR